MYKYSYSGVYLSIMDTLGSDIFGHFFATIYRGFLNQRLKLYRQQLLGPVRIIEVVSIVLIQRVCSDKKLVKC